MSSYNDWKKVEVTDSEEHTNTDEKEKLFKAIEVGDLEKTKKLLTKHESYFEEIVNMVDRYKRTLLHIAAINGRLEIIKIFHQKGADLCAKGRLNNTALHAAAMNGHIDVLAYLLDQELDINQRGEMSRTPLMYAAKFGHFHVVKYLFERGADFNVKDAAGDKAIHIAASYGQKEIVEFMLNKGASANDSGYKNETPVHRAAVSGNVELVASLVEEGGYTTCKSVDGEMPIHFAAMNGHVDVLRFFLNYFPYQSYDTFMILRYLYFGCNRNSVHTLGKHKFTPLHYASCNGELEAVRFLVCEEKADIHAKSLLGNKPVHIAAENGHVHVVEFFLYYCGMDVNEKNTECCSLLDLATANGHLKTVQELLLEGADAEIINSPIHIAAENGHYKIIEQLVEDGVDINFRCASRTPLHQAAAYGDLKTVQFLVGHGADLNAETIFGSTPLELAKEKKNEKVIQFLEGWKDATETCTLHHAVLNGNIRMVLSHIDENVDDEDYKGYTPLFYAAKSGNLDIVELLIRENADPFVKHGDRKFTALHLAAYSNSSEIVDMLADEMKKNFYWDVDVKDIEGNTPLIWAAYRGNIKSAQALIDLNANVNLKNKGGLTSLHIAAENGHLPLIRLLLYNKAEVGATDYVCGRKPMHLAAKGGHTQVVKYLLSSGIGIEEHDEMKNTPLHYAAAFGRCELTKYLVEIGANIDAVNTHHQRPFDLANIKKHSQVSDYFRNLPQQT